MRTHERGPGRLNIASYLLNGEPATYEDCLRACETVEQKVALLAVETYAPDRDAVEVLAEVAITFSR